jgi:uncharacterized Zn finger protein (UPF0148 family)
MGTFPICSECRCALIRKGSLLFCPCCKFNFGTVEMYEKKVEKINAALEVK